MGSCPENALARRFREAQGRLNIALAAHADLCGAGYGRLADWF